MMTGHLLAWVQKLAVQHFTLEVKNLLTKAATFTPVFRLLLMALVGLEHRIECGRSATE